MKRLQFYEVVDGIGVVETSPTAEPADAFAPVMVECPYCPVLVPWNSQGYYSHPDRRTVYDGPLVRPLCLDCSHDVTEAERQAEMDALAEREGT